MIKRNKNLHCWARWRWRLLEKEQAFLKEKRGEEGNLFLDWIFTEVARAAGDAG